jgi:uncharacterized membrane protein
MLNSRLLRFCGAIFLLGLLVVAIAGSPLQLLAQTDTPTPTPSPTAPPKLTLDCPYSALSADVGQTFGFDIDIKYYGIERQTFTLIATPPSGWNATVTGAGFKQITSIQIAAYDENTPGIETITVTFTPDYSNTPGPGVYKGSIKVASNTVSQTMDLRATVTSRYFFALNWTDPSTGSTTTDVTMLGTPGKADQFPFDVVNMGSAEIKGLTLSADAPKNWQVTFNPATVDSLPANQTQAVTATVTPPTGPNAAGDYVLTLKGDNGSVSSQMILRVTIPVQGTSVWLIVGVAAAIIVVLVAAYQLFGKKKTRASAASK